MQGGGAGSGACVGHQGCAGPQELDTTEARLLSDHKAALQALQAMGVLRGGGAGVIHVGQGTPGAPLDGEQEDGAAWREAEEAAAAAAAAAQGLVGTHGSEEGVGDGAGVRPSALTCVQSPLIEDERLFDDAARCQAGSVSAACAGHAFLPAPPMSPARRVRGTGTTAQVLLAKTLLSVSSANRDAAAGIRDQTAAEEPGVDGRDGVGGGSNIGNHRSSLAPDHSRDQGGRVRGRSDVAALHTGFSSGSEDTLALACPEELEMVDEDVLQALPTDLQHKARSLQRELLHVSCGCLRRGLQTHITNQCDELTLLCVGAV